MDDSALRATFAAREQFAPDPDAVLQTVLAHPPVQRSKRAPRRFAAIGIAAAVVLIAGTVGVVRSTTHDVSAPAPTAVPAPPTSALAAALVRNSWSVATVTTGPRTQPLSAMAGDYLFIAFSSDGTVSVHGPLCQSQTVSWTATEGAITIGRLAPEANKCPRDTGEQPSAAAAPLTAALANMSAAPTVGRLDGRSLVLQAGAAVLVLRPSSSAATGLQLPSVEGSAQLWAGFPVGARPRPIVLVGPSVILPAQPLPDGEQENALAAGRFILAATTPTAPATMNGYPVISAAAAIAQFTDAQPTSPARTSLHITRLQLVEQSFTTDRGDTALPTWRVTLAETREPIDVLAVASASRYPQTLVNDATFGEDATLSADGRDLTIFFVAHHVSEGGCDRDRTATVASKQTSAAVVLAVTTQLHPDVPRPGCEDGYATTTSVYPGPGQPDTYTLHLEEPLGNRVAVNQLGTPYVIHQQ